MGRETSVYIAFVRLLIHPKKNKTEAERTKTKLLDCYKQKWYAAKPREGFTRKRRTDAEDEIRRIRLGNADAQSTLRMSVKINFLNHRAVLSTLADKVAEVLQGDFTLPTSLQGLVTSGT